MTSVIDGTRFARAASTRQAIIGAALTLFGRCGYRSISLRDIAAEAGISHPALLKHFAGKDELLLEVARRLDAAAGAAPQPEDPAPFAAQARQQAAIPGYSAFFAALTGEACAPSHPLHDWMAARLERTLAERRLDLERATAASAVDPGRDTADEAVRLTAAWSGLQMLAQYLPGRVDIPAALETHRELIAHPAGWDAGAVAHPTSSAPPPLRPLPLLPEDEAPPASGYRTGRERRARIVDDATSLFAAEGYVDTSLMDVAKRVGVSKSALYHHFPSKDALLHEVLRERDRRIDGTVAARPVATAVRVLRDLADGARANETEQPGLIELYAVISSEATPRGHDAHAYFERRFTRALDGFTQMFRAAADAGDLPAHRRPEHEALWVLALWDGLQYHWLYDRSGVDVAAQLRAHLSDVLPER